MARHSEEQGRPTIVDLGIFTKLHPGTRAYKRRVAAILGMQEDQIATLVEILWKLPSYDKP